MVSTGVSYAQKFTSEKGQVTFFSDAAIEDIEAVNSIVGSLFNATTGELVYIMKIRDFVFHKALMREHFNEKYMESEKFPKATFQGKIIGYKPNTAGEQKVKAVGKLAIHGVTRDIEVPGIVELVNGKMLLKAKFMVKLQDYNIKIPTLVWQNIAEEVQVTIDFIYKPV
jgi:hypothetical protein